MHYVVVDLEMCRVPRRKKEGYGYNREIIQIGAALLNEEYEIVDRFNQLVSPQFGNVDGFIQNLTGIRRMQLTKCPNIETALQYFLDWLPEGEVIPVSWSMTDRTQFKKELELKGIEIPERFQTMLELWIDCQPQFSHKLDRGNKCFSLSEALIAADIPYDENAHDGLVDACNTALLFAKMQTEEELVLNPYYVKVQANNETEEKLTYSLAAIMEQAMRQKVAG